MIRDLGALMRQVRPSFLRRSPMNEHLDLEVIEVEKNAKPGCTGSSSTSPRCTCPVLISPPEEAEQA
jgi:hypothetical protein